MERKKALLAELLQSMIGGSSMSHFNMYKNYPNYNFFNKKITEMKTSSFYERRKMGTENSKNCIAVKRVIDTLSVRHLIEFELPFPEMYPALEIRNNISQIRNIQCNVLKNGILINAELFKSISYSTFEDKYTYNHKGFASEAKYGDLKFVSAVIPFSCYRHLKASRSGDVAEIKFAGTDEACIVDTLIEPCVFSGDKMQLYKSFSEKAVVKIDLIILRDIEVCI